MLRGQKLKCVSLCEMAWSPDFIRFDHLTGQKFGHSRPLLLLAIHNPFNRQKMGRREDRYVEYRYLAIPAIHPFILANFFLILKV